MKIAHTLSKNGKYIFQTLDSSLIKYIPWFPKEMIYGTRDELLLSISSLHQLVILGENALRVLSQGDGREIYQMLSQGEY